MSAKVHQFHNKNDLADQLARKICQQLEEAVQARGSAYLVLSGGSTPIPLFQRLSVQILPWAKITILLADERWIAKDDAASNERLVREHLLQNLAASAQFISLRTDFDSIEQAVSALNERVNKLPTFDVLVLGMGDDGHTASLFPCSEELHDGLTTEQAVLAVHPKTAPHARISMSKHRLLNSRQIFLHLVGQSKKQVLDKALLHDSMFPVSQFLLQDLVPTDVMLALPKE